MLPLQSVELLTRLRRRLGFRGDVQVRADSTASPVIITQDVRGVPWRSEGRRFWVGGALAGSVGTGIDFAPLLTVPSEIGVIDEVWISNETGANQGWSIRAGGTRSLLLSTFVGYSLEGNTDGFTVLGTTNVPVIVEARRDATAATSKVLTRIVVPNNTTAVLRNLELPLVFGQLGPVLVPPNDSAGDVWFSGRLWPLR